MHKEHEEHRSLVKQHLEHQGKAHGKSSDTNTTTTMQHTADACGCRVLMAAMPADGVRSATLNAVTIADNVHFYLEQKSVSQQLSTYAEEALAKAWTNFIQQSMGTEPHSGRERQQRSDKKSSTVQD